MSASTNGALCYLAEDCGCFEKSEYPQQENRFAKLPRQATNRGRYRARLFCQPAHTVEKDTKVSSAKKVLNIQYSYPSSFLAGEIAKWDGRLRVHGEQFHFSYFLLPRVLFVESVCRCSLPGERGSRERERKREREWSYGIFYWRCVWHSARTHPIPPPSSRSRGDSSRASTNSPARDVEKAPRRVRCFRWIDSRALPLCKLPFRRQTLRLVHIPPLGLFL